MKVPEEFSRRGGGGAARSYPTISGCCVLTSSLPPSSFELYTLFGGPAQICSSRSHQTVHLLWSPAFEHQHGPCPGWALGVPASSALKGQDDVCNSSHPVDQSGGQYQVKRGAMGLGVKLPEAGAAAALWGL